MVNSKHTAERMRNWSRLYLTSTVRRRRRTSQGARGGQSASLGSRDRRERSLPVAELRARPRRARPRAQDAMDCHRRRFATLSTWNDAPSERN